MIRLLLTTTSAMQCRPQPGLGRAVVLCAFAEAYRFDGDKSVSEGIHSISAGWLNPDQSTSSGRCRATLTPT